MVNQWTPLRAMINQLMEVAIPVFLSWVGLFMAVDWGYELVERVRRWV